MNCAELISRIRKTNFETLNPQIQHLRFGTLGIAALNPALTLNPKPIILVTEASRTCHITQTLFFPPNLFFSDSRQLTPRVFLSTSPSPSSRTNFRRLVRKKELRGGEEA